MKENAQNDLKKETNGEFRVGHHVYGDWRADGSFGVRGHFTKGDADGRAQPLMNKDLYGNQLPLGKTQKHVPHTEERAVNASWIGSEIPSTRNSLGDPAVAAKLPHKIKGMSIIEYADVKTHGLFSVERSNVSSSIC